jgi:hypothetical protein
MFLIRELNPLSLKLLEQIYRQSRHYQVRQRAHFLILVSQGVKVESLMKTFKVSYKTIYNWLTRWESPGMIGLYNKSGRGRKPTFNPAQEATIREWVKIFRRVILAQQKPIYTVVTHPLHHLRQANTTDILGFCQ